MKPRHALTVFAAAARMGFKQALSEKLALVGAFFIFCVLIISYASIFKWIPAEDLAAHSLTYPQMVWYMATTEFILFCYSFVYYKELQYEIQSDQIHVALLRPCPVWVVKLGDWGGQFVGRFVVLAVPCYILTYFAADQTALSFGAVLGIVASLPLAGFLLLASGFILGVSCLWLKQAEPAYWVWQKCMFLLGAMLWPLALYPELMHSLVWLTPFPSMLAVLGDWVVCKDALTHIYEAMHQILWVGASIVAVAAVNRAALRRIQRSGE